MQINAQISYGGVNAQVGDFLVNRLLPNKLVISVGPIVFLDHVYPTQIKTNGEQIPSGEFAHPHRGIATFSYVFSGKLTHYDSKGHKSTINAGGIQWMKAGNGIIHDEQPFVDETTGSTFHSLQFWINLPSSVKAETPFYQPLQSEDVPEIVLPEGAGTLRVLLGTCGAVSSPIPIFMNEFIYHIRLAPKSRFMLSSREEMEYGGFIPDQEIVVNGEPLGRSSFVAFAKGAAGIEVINSNVNSADVLLFGGSPYNEPIIAEGPFVMNSRLEIAEAYRDFFAGKYGEINYHSTAHQ